MRLPRHFVPRNGHNTIKLLFFPHIISKQFLFKPMLLNKLKCVDESFRQPFYFLLLTPFNK